MKENVKFLFLSVGRNNLEEVNFGCGHVLEHDLFGRRFQAVRTRAPEVGSRRSLVGRLMVTAKKSVATIS